MIQFSLGIPVYNEGQNIGRLLQSVANSQFRFCQIGEIIVIASGCTDNTKEVVANFSKSEPRIRLVEEPSRLGKASAVNLLLTESRFEVVVMCCGDLILETETLERLVAPFADLEVGLTGAHPEPLNNKQSFLGFSAHLLWQLHHLISLESPKTVELIAFRKVFKRIPLLSATDEANIEPLVRGQAYKYLYIPKALVYNLGPQTLGELIDQRRRIFAGHLAVKREQSYEVSTLNPFRILRILLKLSIIRLASGKGVPIRYVLWTISLVGLEGYCRVLGWGDYFLIKKKLNIWAIASSTKKIL